MNWTCTDRAYRKEGDPMNVTTDKPAGLSDEERAAIEAENAARAVIGLAPWKGNGLDDGSDRLMIRGFVSRYRAARVPLEAELTKLRGELDTERMRLAACGVAAMCNTEESIAKQSIGPENPYYSASYHDVCRAVRREIAHSDRAKDLEAQLAQAQKPAAPAGLPEVGTEIEYSLAPGEWLRSKVSRHSTIEGKPQLDGFCVEDLCIATFLAVDEGKTWRRLPPAQTSRDAGLSLTQKGEGAYSPGAGHMDLAAPPPEEVSTENLQKEMHLQNCDGPDEQLGQCDLELVEAVEADIRDAVERERAKWEARIDDYQRRLQAETEHAAFMRSERDQAIEEIRRDKARIVSLEDNAVELKDRLTAVGSAARAEVARLVGERGAALAELKVARDLNEPLRKQMDAALAEVDRIAACLPEMDREEFGSIEAAVSEVVSRHIVDASELAKMSDKVECLKGELARAKLCAWRAALQDAVEFVHSLMGDKSEGWRDATTAIWNGLKGKLDKLPKPTQEKATKRCPADGMSNHELGSALFRLWASNNAAPFTEVGAKARELFMLSGSDPSKGAE